MSGVSIYVRGSVYTSPLGASGDGVQGGRVHVRGQILHRLACFPLLNFGGCPCMSGVAEHVRQLPCTRPLADLVARQYVSASISGPRAI